MTKAFDAVFAAFLAAMLAIAFLALRWAFTRDRLARSRRASDTETDDLAYPRAQAQPGNGAHTQDRDQR